MSQPASALHYSDGFAPNKEVPSRLIRDSRPGLSPVVSITIPTFRRPDLLRESIASALAQITSVPFEVVIVDNDNEGDLMEEVDQVVASFKEQNLRHFRNRTNIGLYGNWNRCLELARGRWVTLLNDDDLLDPSFLEEALRVVARNPSVKLVGCSARVRDMRNQAIPESFLSQAKNLLRSLPDILRGRHPYKVGIGDYFPGFLHQGSLGILVERKAAVEAGGYDPAFYPVADYLFGVRLAFLHDVRYLPKVLATYRIAVNVSTKPEVCALGLHLELTLREAMIPHVPLSPGLLRHYSRLVAIRAASVFKKRWHSQLDVDGILGKEGLKLRPVLAEYLAFRFLVRTGLCLLPRRWISAEHARTLEAKASYETPG